MKHSSDTIAVLGAGAWGTGLASIMAKNHAKVLLWGRDPRICDEISARHSNQKYLPDISLPANIEATTNIARSVENVRTILIVVPVQSTTEVARLIKPHISPNTMLVFCSKGIDRETLKLPSEAAKDILPENDVCVLSGPSFAKDVARGLPTAVTLGHRNEDTALYYANALSTKQFRIYASNDPKGIELAGALKNVVAISVGIARGLALGASAEAALIARGYAEITRLALALGAKPETLLGLAGLGDLVLTCTNTQSRNFSYGIAVGSNKDVSGLALAEGAKTVFMADLLASKHQIDCPLIHVTKLLLAQEISLQAALDIILSRPLKMEHE